MRTRPSPILDAQTRSGLLTALEAIRAVPGVTVPACRHHLHLIKHTLGG